MNTSSTNHRQVRISDFAVGQACERQFVITDRELMAFIESSGDRHPLHTDPAFAKERGHRAVLLHGMCVASRCSMFVTQEFVGSTGMLVAMGADFRRPAVVGEKLQWIGEIIRLVPEAHTVEIKWSVLDSHRIVVQRGTACTWIGNR